MAGPISLNLIARINFSGPTRYRIRSMALLCRSVARVCARRALEGARRPGWNWTVEFGTEFLKRHLIHAFQLADVDESRRYLDSVVLASPAISKISTTWDPHESFRGTWFSPRTAEAQRTMLYLHGGGYSFYPKASYAHLIALITLAAKARTFALDYRLSPEHRFPAQLEDALNAYRWFLETGTDPNHLVVAGDSAGGNLALALLQSIRNAKLPLPALAFALSPPTDFVAPTEPKTTSLLRNEPFDWIEKRMLLKWADWFCDSNQRQDPLVSPLYSDLHGLPPIYIQAGRAEILYDSIQAFVDRAKSEGADVVLESWEDMNHDFQMFGSDAHQSAEALQRLAEIIDAAIAKQLERKHNLAGR